VGDKRFAALLPEIVILVSVVLGGCQPAARKLLPSQSRPSPPASSARPQPPTTARQPASPTGSPGPKTSADDAVRAAVQVAGVQNATAIVSGSTAYLGLQLQPGMEKKAGLIAREVAKRVKSATTGLKLVYVASDPDLVAQVKQVADGIKKGKPVSSFSGELREIARRIKPQA